MPAPQAQPDPPEPCPIPIPPPVPVRPRLDGWTAERQRAFIEHLADHGCVKSACAHVGMSERSVSTLRRRPDAGAFDAACVAAMEHSLDRLVETAFDRATKGALRGKYWKGERIGEEHVPSDRLLMWLIKERGAVLGAGRNRRSGIETLSEQIEEIDDVRENPRPRFRVWFCDITGDARTNAPPPSGLTEQGADSVVEFGSFGDKNYSRLLLEEEWDAWHARPEALAAAAEGDAARRAFFGLPEEG